MFLGLHLKVTSSSLQIQPVLIKKENVPIFMSTLSLTYYDRLIGNTSTSFINMVQLKRTTRCCLNSRLVELGNRPKRLSPTEGASQVRKKPTQFLATHLGVNISMLSCSHLLVVYTSSCTSSLP